MNDLSEMKMEYCTVVDLMYEYFTRNGVAYVGYVQIIIVVWQ